MLAALFFTPGGKKIALRLREHFDLELYTTKALRGGGAREIEGPLDEFLASLWGYEGIIFISATGIAVRALAPNLKGKSIDPPVVCMDEGGSFAISLLSGHGGANHLAGEIAGILGATPVITTSTDVQGLPSLEALARRYSLVIERKEDIKKANSAIARGENFAILSDYLKEGKDLPLYPLNSNPPGYDFYILVTNRLVDREEITLRPRNLFAGVGFSSRARGREIAERVEEVLRSNNLSSQSLCALASVDFKAQSREMGEASRLLGVGVVSLSREEIKKVEGNFEASSLARRKVGLGSVAQPSTYLASGGGKILVEKVRFEGVTVSIAEER